MCDKCFSEQIESFRSKEDFEKFDLELTMKIANEKSIKMGKFVNTAWKDIGYQIYICKICKQQWKLSAPDTSGKGYFLQLK